MNLSELSNLMGQKHISKQFGSLPVDLVGALGGEIRVPTHLSLQAEEVARKLVGIDFIIQGEALGLCLIVEDDGKSETMTIPGIVKASYDHGYGGYRTMGKYYVTLDTGMTIRILVGLTTEGSEKYQKEHFGAKAVGARVDTRII